MYEMLTEIPFTRTGVDQKLKLHEAVGMMMDCSQFQEYQEKHFCEYLRTKPFEGAMAAMACIHAAVSATVERKGADDE